MSLVVGQKFSSYQELKIALHQYIMKNKVHYYKRDSKTIKSHYRYKTMLSDIPSYKRLIYYLIHYSCVHGGRSFSKHYDCKFQRKTKTYRIGCPSYILVMLSRDCEYLEVKKINEEHNHDISDILFTLYPRERRRRANLKELQSDNILAKESNDNLEIEEESYDCLQTQEKSSDNLEIEDESEDCTQIGGDTNGVYIEEAKSNNLLHLEIEGELYKLEIKKPKVKEKTYEEKFRESVGVANELAKVMLESSGALFEERMSFLQDLINCWKNGKRVISISNQSLQPITQSPSSVISQEQSLRPITQNATIDDDISIDAVAERNINFTDLDLQSSSCDIQMSPMEYNGNNTKRRKKLRFTALEKVAVDQVKQKTFIY